MKLLFLAQGYPSPTSLYSMAFVHTRSREYVRRGIDVTVLSFSAKESYELDGVHVRTEKDLLDVRGFDAVVSHAPNVRNHIRFLLRHPPRRLIFVFHGHEALTIKDYYPEPYVRLRSRAYPALRIAQHGYDLFKTNVLSLFLRRSFASTRLVFVSEWMRRAFLETVRVDRSLVFERSLVIHNPANAMVLSRRHRRGGEKVADFLTIRPFDDAKYAVDVVVEFARVNPELRFHLLGRGSYFSHHACPENLKILGDFVPQSELPNLMDGYRAALMPTRSDTQGVTMCEMAVYGMPLITSDLDVCHEMLDGFPNVSFLRDFTQRLDSKYFDSVPEVGELPDRFSLEKTVHREIDYVTSWAAS